MGILKTKASNRDLNGNRPIPASRMIVTHDGHFHADEVFACALVQYVLPGMRIVRTRQVTQAMVEHPECWILDVNRLYDPAKRCFDHHQDKDLPATNILILGYLYGCSLISSGLYAELEQDMMTVSYIDTRGYDEFNGWQVNSLIKSFNSLDDGWERALDLARAVIDIAVKRVEEAELSLEIWGVREVIEGGRIAHTIGFPVKWKEYNSGCIFLVEESDARDGEFKVHSFDSYKYPILKGFNESFIHNGKHLAVYCKLEHAREAAQASLNTVRERLIS